LQPARNGRALLQRLCEARSIRTLINVPISEPKPYEINELLLCFNSEATRVAK